MSILGRFWEVLIIAVLMSTTAVVGYSALYEQQAALAATSFVPIYNIVWIGASIVYIVSQEYQTMVEMQLWRFSIKCCFIVGYFAVPLLLSYMIYTYMGNEYGQVSIDASKDLSLA
jgi:hypothetical protein